MDKAKLLHQYHEQHARCPRCCANDSVVQQNGGWNIGREKNPYRAWCESCGWSGRIEELLPDKAEVK